MYDISDFPLNQLSLVELRALLEERGLSTCGRRDELLARLLPSLENEVSLLG